MLNIDSTLHSSLNNFKKYEQQTIEAKELLDPQFAPSIIEYLNASVSKYFEKQHVSKKKITIRTEEDPKRVIAWTIAQKIREAREKHELRQEDLAKMTGIARPNIARIEQGRHVPALTTLNKIADALQLDMASLTAQPGIKAEDRLEFAEMAESGIGGWRKTLEDEDNKN